MKIMGETSVNKFISDRAIYGLIVLRVISKIDMDGEVAKSTVISHMRGELQVGIENSRYGSTIQSANKRDIDTLETYPIQYVKKSQHIVNGDTYYYIQIVLQIHNTMRNDRSWLPDAGRYYVSHMYDCGRTHNLINATVPLEEICYAIATVRPNKGGDFAFIGNKQDWAISVGLEQIMTPQNDIAININIDRTRKMAADTEVQVEYDIYENIEQAFAHKTPTTMSICQYDGWFGVIGLKRIQADFAGFYKIASITSKTLQVRNVEGVFVFYEGQKSLEAALPYIPQWKELGIRQVNITQYGMKTMLFNYHDRNLMDRASRVVNLYFFPQKALSVNGNTIEYTKSSGQLYGSIVVRNPQTGRRENIETTITCKRGNYASFVVPVNEGDAHIKAMEIINKLLLASVQKIPSATEGLAACGEYHHIIQGELTQADDLLSMWFANCTRAARHTDNSIINAYMKMKNDLENEYLALDAYLKHHDFSKCIPVPSVSMDKKMEKNYYNTLHLEPKNVIIKSIRNQNIIPIDDLIANVTIMMPIRDRFISNGYDFIKYYNARDNHIMFDYDRMKGDLINDKVKNRR